MNKGVENAMMSHVFQPNEISIRDKKQLIKGQVTRAVLFSPCKILEMVTSDNSSFYLLFYKNSFVYGESLDHVENGSFIDTAFHNGIVLDQQHPFLSVLIPNKCLTIPNKHKLLSLLSNQYSPVETAYIITTLDSFFEKDHLKKWIDQLFYHYRRNGNFFKAFQILRIVTDYSPELSSLSDSIHAQEFHAYDTFYTSSPIKNIYKKDPLYVELHCWHDRLNPDSYKILDEILINQNRQLDSILVWMEKKKQLSSTDFIGRYTNMALQFVTIDIWILTLSYLNINPFRELPETLNVINKMISDKRYETAALLVLNNIDGLPDAYNKIVKQLCMNLDAEFVLSHIDGFLMMCGHLIDRKLEDFEVLLFKLTGALLETYDLLTVHEKLKPFQCVFPDSLVLKKLNRMVMLLEDPDHMMELGQYYAEFKKYDEAIECFSWEMELHPEDYLPVWQISKMYQQKGMKDEAIAYQQIYNQLKSNQSFA
jgi:tetratricopeptide (TPR) repeat protein